MTSFTNTLCTLPILKKALVVGEIMDVKALQRSTNSGILFTPGIYKETHRDGYIESTPMFYLI